jgi:hypothetical protein
MVPNIIAVLDPTAKSKVKEIPTAPRVNDLNGKVVGFLWNKKANGDLLLLRIKEQLSERFKLAGTNWHEKAGPGLPAAMPIIEDFIRTADVVINGQGD